MTNKNDSTQVMELGPGEVSLDEVGKSDALPGRPDVEAGDLAELIHYTPQFIIKENGSIDLFDPEGPLEGGKKAREFQRANPTAGDLAELIEGQIRIEAVALSPASDTYVLMWWDGRIYRPGAEKVIASAVQTIMGKKARKELVNETIAFIERMKHLRTKVPEQGGKLCVQNGILDLDTGELGRFRSDLVFTSMLPVRYDPDAEAYLIGKFLHEVLNKEAGTDPDGKFLDFYALMEYLGTTLEPDYRWQKGAILVGQGANGKSVFLSVLTAFLGEENVSSVSMEELGGGDKHASADLVGKWANICADISGGAMRDTATLKKALGGDLIHAQRKYGQPFAFKNQAKMFFSCNSIPESSDLSIGWTRRWIIFDFPHQFLGSDADPDLARKLSTPKELSGLLNLALEGRRRLIEQGYFTGHLDAEKDRDCYLLASDPATSFLAKECYLQMSEVVEDGLRSPIPETPVSELYLVFVDWCAEKKVVPPSQDVFSRKVQTVYPGVSKVRKWIGERKKDARFLHVWYGMGLSSK